MGERFAVSRRTEMQPLYHEGIGAAYCYAQLQAFLVRHQNELAARGMPAPAQFLAEPQHESSGLTDWFAPGDGIPVPLAQLNPAAQMNVLQELAGCANALKGFLAEKAGEFPGPLPGLLRLAVEHPSQADIFVLGGHPLLINWGFARGEGQPVPSPRLLHQPPQAAPVRQAAPSPAGVPESAAVQTPLTAPAAPGPAPLSQGPRPEPVQTVPPTVPEEAPSALPTSAGPAEPLTRLAAQVTPGAPGSPAASPAPGPESPVQELLPQAQDLPPAADRMTQVSPAAGKRRIPGGQTLRRFALPAAMAFAFFLGFASFFVFQQAGQSGQQTSGSSGQVSASEPAPGPEPPAKPAVAPGTKFAIPESAASGGDLSFLEGCWRNAPSEDTPSVDLEFCFRADGQGERHIRTDTGGSCQGPVRTSYEGGTLRVEADRAACTGGPYWLESLVSCQGTGENTSCQGWEADGSPWEARLVRR